MVWTNAGVIHPSRNWQYTNVVEGEFFRLSHNFSDLPTEYFQAGLTQIEEGENGEITTFGYQVIEASPTSEVIRLTKPECFSNRKIAIRQLSRDVDLPPAGRVYSWAIGIETFIPEVQEPEVQTLALTFASPGDANGLFHYLGTNNGTAPWSNPYLAQKLGIEASSVLGGQSPIESLVDRQGSYFHTQSQPNPWIQFVLPAGKLFTLKQWAYQARNNNYVYIPERLIVSVSTDGQTFTQVDDQSMGVAQGNWFVSPTIATAPAAKIIRFTYPGNSYFTAGEFELYGSITI